MWAYSCSIENDENKYKNQNISHKSSALILTTQVASYSILTIHRQLLVVCLTLVRWPTTVTAKALTLQQKEKPHGKNNNLPAKRKRLAAKRETSWQKEKDSKQKENLTAKRKSLTAEFLWYREDNLIFISFAVSSWLLFLLWAYCFCRKFFPSAVRLILFAVTVVGHRTFVEILFPKILHF